MYKAIKPVSFDPLCTLFKRDLVRTFEVVSSLCNIHFGPYRRYVTLCPELKNLPRWHIKPHIQKKWEIHPTYQSLCSFICMTKFGESACRGTHTEDGVEFYRKAPTVKTINSWCFTPLQRCCFSIDLYSLCVFLDSRENLKQLFVLICLQPTLKCSYHRECTASLWSTK